MKETINTEGGSYTPDTDLRDNDSTRKVKEIFWIDKYFKEFDENKRRKIAEERKQFLNFKELTIITKSTKKVRLIISWITKSHKQFIHYEKFKEKTIIILPGAEYQIELSKKKSFFKRERKTEYLKLDKNKELKF